MAGLWTTSRRWLLLFVATLASTQCVGPPNRSADATPPPVVVTGSLNCSEGATSPDVETAPPMHKIAFIENGTLSLMDPDGGNVTPVAENVALFIPAPDARHLLYRSTDGQAFLYALRAQEVRPLERLADFPGGIYGGMTWSQDGGCLIAIDNENKRLGLYHLRDGRVEEWRHPLAGSIDSLLAVSPDGNWLATMGCAGIFDLCIASVDGKRLDEIERKDFRMLLEWSPDSRYVLYYDAEQPGHLLLPDTLYYVDRDSGWTPSILLQIAPMGSADLPGFGKFAWSPDGSRIVVEIGSRSAEQIAIVDFPQGSYRVLDLGRYLFPHSPSWAPDGESIVFAGYELSIDGDQPHDVVYKAKADGTGLTLLRRIKVSPELSATGLETPYWLKIPKTGQSDK